MSDLTRVYCERCGRLMYPKPGERLCSTCKQQRKLRRDDPDLPPPLQ